MWTFQWLPFHIFSHQFSRYVYSIRQIDMVFSIHDIWRLYDIYSDSDVLHHLPDAGG